jgi:hypothetical protein
VVRQFAASPARRYPAVMRQLFCSITMIRTLMWRVLATCALEFTIFYNRVCGGANAFLLPHRNELITIEAEKRLRGIVQAAGHPPAGAQCRPGIALAEAPHL